MRVLLTSKFLHYVGGVETYLRWLAFALAEDGHEVGFVGMSPPEGETMMALPDSPKWLTPTRSYKEGSKDRARSAATSIWSLSAGGVMKTALAEFEPDLVHFHGTCYQLTPAVVQATMDAHVPAVLTAHEYKLICANQTLFDDVTQSICTDCVGASYATKVGAPLRRNCMKGSRAVTLLGSLEGQVSVRVWKRSQPLILAPSQFMRARLLDDGWAHDRVRYLDLPWRKEEDQVTGMPSPDRRNIVFIGRLVALKGAERLIRAWSKIHERFPNTELRLLGAGDQADHLVALVEKEQIPRVAFLGHRTPPEIQRELAHAAVAAQPSQCHENSPFSVREALMAGVPVVVSNVGGMPEMVGPNSGQVVPYDDDDAWAEALSAELSHSLAGSPALRDEVMNRAVTERQHLAELHAAYVSRLAEGA